MLKKDSGRWYIRTYASKVVLFVSLLIIVIIVVQSFIFIRTETAYLQDRLVGDKKSFAELLAINLGVAQTVAGFAFQSNLIEEAGETSDTVYVRFVKPSGEIYLSNIVEERGAVVRDPTIKTDKTVVKDDIYEEESIKVVVSPVSGGYTVWLGFSLQRVHAAVNERVRAILLVSFAILIIANFIAYFIARRMTYPLKELRKGVEVIGKGNLDYKLAVKSRDEIGELASTFNQMVSDLRASTTSIDNLNKEIAERKRAEEEIRVFSNAVAGALDAIAITDMKGIITYANSAMEEIYGYKKEEILGKSVISLNLNPEMANEIMSTMVKTGSWNGEIESIKKNKETFPALLSLSTVRDEKGNPIAMMRALRDITERKRMEEQLRVSNAELGRSNAELERFAYIASHDLQEPLRMVTSYTKLLEKRYKDRLDADAHDFIEYAVDGAKRMQQLINDLLTYSRVGTRGKPFEPTDCVTVFEAAVANLGVAIRESDAEVTSDPLPTVMADEGQLAQLFQNLIDNAIKFHGEEPPRVHVSVEQRGDEWVFSVQDNGIGIEPQNFERAFMVFQRLHGREYRGTGIGLSIAKRIVERHGGRIWLESQSGKGTIVYFTIPAKGGKQS